MKKETFTPSNVHVQKFHICAQRNKKR